MKSLYNCVIPVFPITVPRSDAEDVKEKWQQGVAQAQGASSYRMLATHLMGALHMVEWTATNFSWGQKKLTDGSDQFTQFL